MHREAPRGAAGDPRSERTLGRMSRTVVGLLVAALILQLGWLARVHVKTPTTIAIEPGEALPFELGGPGDIAGAPAAEAFTECRVAFVCSPTCPWCARLADRLAEDRGQDSSSAAPLWFLFGDPASVRAWAVSAGLAPSTVFSLAPKRRGFGRKSVFGQVSFTPTRLILAPALEVRDVRPSDEVPSRSALSALCAP